MLVISSLLLITVSAIVKRCYDLSTQLSQFGNSCHGQPYTLWSYTKDWFKCFAHSRELICKGYAKFVNSSTPFVIPTLLNGPTIVLPPSLAYEVCHAADSELDFRKAVITDGLQANYLFPGVSNVPFHAAVFRRQLANSAIQARAGTVLEEADMALQMALPQVEEKEGMQADWSETKIYNTVMMISTEIVMREFIGLQLCRDRDFLRTLVDYFASVRLSAGLLNQCPSMLRRIVSKVVLIPLRRHRRYLVNKLMPIVETHKAFLESSASKEKDQETPNLLYSILAASKDLADSRCYSTEQIIDRFLMSAFVAVHTTSIVLYAAIYQLPHNPSIFEELRTEALGAFTVEKSPNLSVPSPKLFRTEKFIYECLRHGHQNLLVIRRVVAAKEGYLFSNGYRAPRGAVVAFPGYEMHRDINLHKQRETLYSTRSQTAHAGSSGTAEDVDYTTDPKLLGDHFLIFGNGRHVCPGRFLAVTALKYVIAILTIKYELRLKEANPMTPGRWIWENVMPDEKAVLLIRERPSKN